MSDGTVTRAEPIRSRPILPDGYGVPEVDEGMVEWSWAVEQLTNARNYWFSTTRPDGRPHAMPAWAVWVDDALYFDGSPETRRGRNLAKNPAISVHLESGDNVVILEGEALEAGKPSADLAQRLVAAFEAKYAASHDYHPESTSWDEGGLWRLQPKRAFGWTSFPTSLTRWKFSA
ncbi:MAG: pyridoxamine 5'-phosphate oxidase family protein [Chloroflexi bacterium]|nr:pyridoxamine 5'-phosphate oxidase family protein [Chloroflexota bacterium]MBV9894154.1 pyridoxamine 5'-phosphate oxidase family protein [Chloroflexota bacterium]